MLDVMHNTPFTDMNDSEGETQGMGYEAFASAGRVLDLLAALMAEIRIDETRVRDNIRRSCITVTELADSLVRREGLSFREAHEIAAAVAKAVVAVQGDLAEHGYKAFMPAFSKATGREASIDAATFAEIVSPEHFVAVRNRLGGPAPEALQTARQGYRAQLDALTDKARSAAEREAAAARELNEKFSLLLGET
jgi:argininosuccinate lyase